MSWSHYIELLKFDDLNVINYYIEIYEVQNLSVRELKTKIKNHEYERLNEETKNKLIFHKEERNINQDKTIGIIICKKDNQFVMEYCSDERIYKTTYELVKIH